MSRLRELASMSRLRELVKAIRDGDEAMVEAAVLRMSRSRRWLAPLALAVGALEMLFEGVKLVFSNWRLTLVQILPAMWIWLAMLDLKAHVLHGRSFHVLRGPIVIPVVALIAAITAAAFFLNAVFAFAIARAGPPEVRAGVAGARRHLPVVLGSGAVVGLLLGVADDRRHPLGTPVVHLVARRGDRRADGLLRRGAVEPHRHQAQRSRDGTS